MRNEKVGRYEKRLILPDSLFYIIYFLFITRIIKYFTSFFISFWRVSITIVFLQPLKWGQVILERCLSGRKERFAKSSYGLNCTVGSNPTLSAR